jgi:hypothetical protein
LRNDHGKLDQSHGKFEAVNVDHIFVLFVEADSSLYFWAPDQGEPKIKVVTVSSTAIVAGITRRHEGVVTGNKVAN